MSDEKKKREDLLIMEGSPCEYNFHPDGPRTLDEATKLSDQVCPNFKECKVIGHSGYRGQSCIMLLATCLARERLNGNTSRFEMLLKAINPPNGYIHSEDRIIFIIVKDKEKAHELVYRFVDQLISKS